MGPFLSIIKNNKYTMLSENCATFVNYIQPVVYNWFLQALRLF